MHCTVGNNEAEQVKLMENISSEQEDPRFGGYKSKEERYRAMQITGEAASLYALCAKMQFICGTLQTHLADWDYPLPDKTDRTLSKTSDRLDVNSGTLRGILRTYSDDCRN